MIPQDYHIHTNFSCDSSATMSSMCQIAIKKGIHEIGFSEHLDHHPKDECTGFFRVEEWWEELDRCREKFRGELIIRAGIEISEPHQYPDEVDALLGAFPWDYALGSLHWIDDDIVFEEDYFHRSEREAYVDYLNELESMVEVGTFDILAHMDTVKRYGYEYYGKYNPVNDEAQIRRILNAAASRNVALEINTITLRRPVNETSPSLKILEWFREEGGRWITLGSDAHTPEEVAKDVDLALKLVRNAGYSLLAQFNQRQPSPLKLPGY
ncbi:MAG: histidinol-phosphatase HisJ family protein [Anaerolineales bacterium]|nr:histidinol-phosphatase HisJ family protein [Anaerolineales bacterium]